VSGGSSGASAAGSGASGLSVGAPATTPGSVGPGATTQDGSSVTTGNPTGETTVGAPTAPASTSRHQGCTAGTWRKAGSVICTAVTVRPNSPPR
jgi:hypothetical protein